ncbi:MAG TPA: YicC family protein [Candidatus Cloacimonas sp.]|nr:YicC family protein [Candidatus Cloacimonas sp.]
MKSMTGFGSSLINRDNIEIELEIKSINARFLDLRIFLPRELSFYETEIRQHIIGVLSRGTIEVRINFNDYREPKLVLNKTKLLKYNDLAMEAAKLLASEEIVSIEFLLKEQGVIEIADRLAEDEMLANVLNEALEQALHRINESMLVEGRQIKQMLIDSMQKIQKALNAISEMCEPFKKELFETMHRHIEELMGTYPKENLEQRLIQELAIYIDKYDIGEELSRLYAHINTFNSTLQGEGDIGKTLNFIIQEMQREANTLGSKFSTAQSFPWILAIKEEIEKCREMIQNVA